MRPRKVQNNCAFGLSFLTLFSANKLLGRYKREPSSVKKQKKNRILMFIKVCSFRKLHIQQKILVASWISESLSLDRISINFTKIYLLTIRIPCRGQLMQQLDADTTFFHWPLNVSPHTPYACLLLHLCHTRGRGCLIWWCKKSYGKLCI